MFKKLIIHLVGILDLHRKCFSKAKFSEIFISFSFFKHNFFLTNSKKMCETPLDVELNSIPDRMNNTFFQK